MPGTRIERKTYDTLPAGQTLRPLRDGILVKVLPLALSETIHAHWNGSAVRGEVVAVGKGHYPNRHSRGTTEGKEWRKVHSSVNFRPTEVKVGQIVHLGGMENGGYLFTKLYIDHEEHVLATERDICGIEI